MLWTFPQLNHLAGIEESQHTENSQVPVNLKKI